MNIRRVKIVSTEDFSENGILTVLDEDTEERFYAFYTSPYGATKHGGFVAIPMQTQYCLVCSVAGLDTCWYYLASIYGQDKIEGVDMGEDISYYSSEELIAGQIDSTLPKRTKTYEDGIPKKLSLSSPAGNRLEVADGEVAGISLKSQKGKIITLTDNTNGDAIVIQNEHGDSIVVASKNNNGSGARGISVGCKGSVVINSNSGNVNINVVQGEEINISNRSHKDQRAGNINLFSYEGDVNIASYGEDGSINLTTKHLTSPVNIKSGGDINLEAKGRVNIKGELGTNLLSKGPLNFEGLITTFNGKDLSSIYSGINLAGKSMIGIFHSFPPSSIPSTIIYDSIVLPINDYDD